MFALLVLLHLLLCHAKIHEASNVPSDEDFTNLVASMRDDVNLDLPPDEEYEDLRAELLAYHSALATLNSIPERRSMKSTPCWTLGGICVDYKLCTGFRFLTEVPGCKDRLMVCCFAWNNFKVKDWTHKDLRTLAMPWSHQPEFGGNGIVIKQKDKSNHKDAPKTKLNKHENDEEEPEIRDRRNKHKAHVTKEDFDINRNVQLLKPSNKGTLDNKHNVNEVQFLKDKNEEAFRFHNLDKTNFLKSQSKYDVQMDASGPEDENFEVVQEHNKKDDDYEDSVDRNSTSNVNKKAIALILRGNK